MQRGFSNHSYSEPQLPASINSAAVVQPALPELPRNWQINSDEHNITINFPKPSLAEAPIYGGAFVKATERVFGNDCHLTLNDNSLGVNVNCKLNKQIFNGFLDTLKEELYFAGKDINMKYFREPIQSYWQRDAVSNQTRAVLSTVPHFPAPQGYQGSGQSHGFSR